MKKLVIGDVVIQRVKASCNYCNEEKMCFRSPHPFLTQKTEVVWALKNGIAPSAYLECVGGGWFSVGSWKHVVPRDNFEVRHVVTNEMDEDYMDICKDCAKQLGKV